MKEQIFMSPTGRKVAVGFAYTDYDYEMAESQFERVAKTNKKGEAAYDCYCGGYEFAGIGKFMNRALTAKEKKDFEAKVLKEEFFDQGWTLVA
ncbi:hypothetical protein [Fibrobacter sp.]|uniref:hypothetical protein n=1 Tax=Fibrobacter sp. TaxID=35828 RepID=UPI003868A96C